MKIYAGALELIHSGTVQSDGLEPVKFNLAEDPVMQLVVKVKFDGKNAAVKNEVVSDHEMHVIFENPEGVSYGHSKPVAIGNLDDRHLFMALRISTFGDNTSYTVHYNFYLGEAME